MNLRGCYAQRGNLVPPNRAELNDWNSARERLGGGQLVLGMVATVLAVFTLWLLKWVDVMIPREHRARLVVRSDASWSVMDELPRLLGPMSCRTRFQEHRRDADTSKVDYTFELAWRLPERAMPPMELLTILDRRFEIKSFELTTDNGR